MSGRSPPLYCTLTLIAMQGHQKKQCVTVVSSVSCKDNTLNVSIATRFFFFLWETSLFPSIYCTISAFSLYGEYVVRPFLPNCFFYLVTTGWIFDISLCENSVNQSTNLRISSMLLLWYFLSFFLFFHLTYSRWISSLPSCMWSQRIFPSLPGSRLTIFLSRCRFSTLTTRQLMVEFYLLTFPRFSLRKKEHKSYSGKTKESNSRLPY